MSQVTMMHAALVLLLLTASASAAILMPPPQPGDALQAAADRVEEEGHAAVDNVSSTGHGAVGSVADAARAGADAVRQAGDEADSRKGQVERIADEGAKRAQALGQDIADRLAEELTWADRTVQESTPDLRCSTWTAAQAGWPCSIAVQ